MGHWFRSLPLRSVRCVVLIHFIFSVLPSSALSAQTSPGIPADVLDHIPPDLKPWIPWVLHDHPDLGCPLVNGSRACLWPGAVQVAVHRTRGTFELWVRTDRKIAVPLPGNPGAWPQEVLVNGEQVPVLASEGRPVTWLEPGTYRVTGTWRWTVRPQRLRLPPGAGIVDLTVDGQPVLLPAVDKDGWVRLGTGPARSQTTEKLVLSVSRRLDDGVPFKVTTQIAIRAAGRGREVRLEHVLIPGTVPVALTADLPARFGPSGDLTLQVRPGTFSVNFVALHQGPVQQVTAPAPGGAWPDTEYWVVATDDRVRAVTMSGLPGVDPARTSLPDEWRTLPAYVVHPGDVLTFHEMRRGEPEPPPNRLSLQRDLWLDLDGRGMTVRDRFTGTMTQGWRLDVTPPARLGHVVDHDVDQVITRHAGREGVELRRESVDLVAESRIETVEAQLPAVGWFTDVSDLTARLHLPPGWLLVGVSGVDQPAATVIDRWSLFDLFFVLMVALAAAKLLGWPWGILGLAALALSRHDPDAPEWLWPTLLVLAALLRVVPDSGRVHTVLGALRIGFLATLFVMLLPYGVHEVRTAFAPVLERPWVTGSGSGEVEPVGTEGFGMVDSSTFIPGTTREAQPSAVPATRRKTRQAVGANQPMKQMGGNAFAYRGSEWSLQQDPTAVVQTGPGVPSWQWTTHMLRWTGSVSSDHNVRLFLVGPLVGGALSLVKVALLVLLALRFAVVRKWFRRPRSVPAVLLLAGCTALAMVSGKVAAGPTVSKETGVVGFEPEILQELEKRLTEAPSCQPDCLTVARVHLEIGENALRVVAEIHGEVDGAWPLPGPASVWVPARVLLDGRPWGALARLPDGFLHVRVAAGVTEIVAEGPLPPTDSVTLRLGVLPRLLTWSSQAWTVDGVHADGTVDRAIQITRIMKSSKKPERSSTENLAPWVQVLRTLDLAIPWQVTTKVTRIGPSTAPLAFKVPLLAGEAVMDDRLEVRDGAVQVTLDRDQREVSWRSSLEERAQVNLVAPANVDWNERWVVRCSPVFRCRADGLAPLRHVDDGRWAPEWWPWPGEKVTVNVDRLEAVSGQTVTVDRARLEYRPGKRRAEAVLFFVVRSSQGGQQVVTLPEGSHLQAVRVDGKAVPVQATEGKVPVPIQPGEQEVSLEWQQGIPQGLKEQGPAVDLGSPGVNVTVSMQVPEDRWILWLSGPDWGPVPLFWSHVLIVLIAAPLLRRIPHTSLTTAQWCLLGLGMVPASPFIPLVIVVWFALLGHREHHPPAKWWLFDLEQLVIMGTTLAALGALYFSVQHGLLGDAPADIAGNGSTRSALAWYVDRMNGSLPRPTVWSVPIWVWRVVMLAWSLWLAASLVKWVPAAWHAFAAQGLWRPIPFCPLRWKRRGSGGDEGGTSLTRKEDSGSDGTR